MIIEYHRPKNLEDALALLARKDPLTVPMGGGSLLNGPSVEPIAVVDLQDLGLNDIKQGGNALEVGATATLQQFTGWLSAEEKSHAGESPYSAALTRAILLEATSNLRNVATVAGTLAGSDGRSPFTTCLLALDARLSMAADGPQGEAETAIGDFLLLRSEQARKGLITRILLPLNARLGFEVVARTPADRPVVCVAVARWPSGRTRVALGGYGRAPVLALDGPEPGGAEMAARSAYVQAGDEWASAEYRQEIAALLTRRCIEGLSE